MKISEVIAKLEALKAKHGDLRCVCHDGLDPSDPAEVVDIELDDGGLKISGSWSQLVAFIRS